MPQKLLGFALIPLAMLAGTTLMMLGEQEAAIAIWMLGIVLSIILLVRDTMREQHSSRDD